MEFADEIIPSLPIGVVPVLTGPLQVLLAVLPALLAALAGLLLRLLSPPAFFMGLRLAWRLKVPLVVMAASLVGVGWAATSIWPQSRADRPAERGDDWPMFRGGPRRTGTVAEDPAPGGGGIRWSFRSGKAGFFASPAVVGNRVYAATAETAIFGNGRGEIIALDADTGALAWRGSVPGYRATFSSPVVAGDYLVCGEGLHLVRDARVVCLDLRPGREGTVLWTHATKSHVECTPVIHEGRVYVGAGDDGFYCLELAPGPGGRAQVAWHVPGEKYPDAETSLIVDQGRVYAGLGLNGMALCVLDAATGRELARIPTGLPVFGPPAIDGGRLYVGMGNGDYVHSASELGQPPAGAVWCIDLASLDVLWRFPVRDTVLGGVAVEGDRLYFGSRDGFLYSLDTGGRLAGKWNSHAPIIASPAVTGRRVYFVNTAGMLYGLDRRTLALEWEFALGTRPLFISSPAVARGCVYVGTQFDGLMCVGEPAAKRQETVWPGHLGGPGQGGARDDSPLARRGAFQWQYPADQLGEPDAAVAAPCAVAGNSVIVPLAGGPGRSGVCALPADAPADATPPPRWYFQTPHDVVLSPAIAGDHILAVDGRPGDGGRRLYALDLASGTFRWSHPVGTAASGVFSCSMDEVWIQDAADRLTRLDFAGRPAWTMKLGTLSRAVTPAGELLIAAVADPPSLAALDRRTGTEVWRVPLAAPPTTSAAVRQTTLYVGTEKGLEARSLIDGALVAGFRPPPGKVTSDFVLAESYLAYVGDRGTLELVSLADGASLASLPGADPGTAPLLARGTLLYFGKGSLWAYSPGEKDAAPVAWVDVAWLGKPATGMVLDRSHVYAGMNGWGLVRWGASQ